MMNGPGSGDRLARGASSAKWGVNNVSQQKWDDIFGEDSGPKLNNIDSGNTNIATTGTPGVVSRKVVRRKKQA